MVALAHTFRALTKHTDGIRHKEIEELTTPTTGTPLVYTLNRQTLTPEKRSAMAGLSAGTTGRFRGFAWPTVVDDAPLVHHGLIIAEDITEAPGNGGALAKPITICNHTWRVLSGPGVIEDAELKGEYRKVAGVSKDDDDGAEFG